MKTPIALLAALTLSACGGASGPKVVFTGLEDTNFSSSDLTSRGFGGRGVSLRGDLGAPNVSVKFNSPLSATLTVDGETYALSNLDGEGYRSGSGAEEVIVSSGLRGGPETRDVLYIIASDRPTPFLGGRRISFAVDGSRTGASALPTGSVRYTGAAVGASSLTQTANGRAEINVNFADDSFDARLTGINPGNASAVYVVTGGSETAGALSGNLTGGTNGAGSLNGHIYGRRADQAAGTFSLADDGDNIIGMFGAVD